MSSPSADPQWQPEHGTWLYVEDGLKVAVNPKGEVVTIMVNWL